MKKSKRMDIKPLAWLIAKGYVSPAFGRFVETLVAYAVAAGMVYVADSLTGGEFPELKQLSGVMLAAAYMYVSKRLRDAASDLKK